MQAAKHRLTAQDYLTLERRSAVHNLPTQSKR